MAFRRPGRFDRIPFVPPPDRAAGVATAALAGLAGVCLDNWTCYVMALVAMAMALPLATIFRCDKGWPRRAMTAFSGLMAASGCLTIVGTYLEQPWEASTTAVFFTGFLATPCGKLAGGADRPPIIV